MFSFSDSVFTYSQDLDNKGGSEYWMLEQHSGYIQKLTDSDSRRRDIRNCIDELTGFGKYWFVNEFDINCRLRFSGECIIKLLPVSCDVSGRVSPVVVFFNIFELQAENLSRIVFLIERKLGRKLSEKSMEGMNKLEKYLSWPRWFLFLNVLFFSRSTK